MTSAAERACALVSNMLANGPRDAAEIRAAAEGDNISERTIQRAAIALGVTKTKAGFNGGWTWRLPADDGGAVNEPAEQPAPCGARCNLTSPNGGSQKVEPSRAEVIAARLRKLEAGRGKVAPIYAGDPRVMRWAQSGISDPDLKEAYERAVFDLEGKRDQAALTAGLLDPFIWDVTKEAA